MITYLIAERTKEEKQVQLVAGVTRLTYWSTASVWDLGVTIVFVAMSGAILQAFQTPSYTGKANFLAVSLLLFFFCTASISLVYCVEKTFREPSLGQIAILCGSILFGIITMIIVIICETLWWIPSVQVFKEVISYVFLLIPSFALGDGLMDLTTNQLLSSIYESLGESGMYTWPLEWKLIGRNICFLAIETILFGLLNLAIEYGFFTSMK